MQKIILSTLFFLLCSHFSFGQAKDYQSLIKNAQQAYLFGDFENAIDSIKEIRQGFKNPPPIVLSLEILSNIGLLKSNPMADFDRIATTRLLSNKYLTNANNKSDKYYNTVAQENVILNSYPKDRTAFKVMQESIQKEEQRKREQQVRAAAQEKERKKILEENEIKRLEALKVQKEQERLKAERDRLEQAERDRLAKIQAEKDRQEQATMNQLRQAEAEKQRIIQDKKDRKKLKSFSSLGFQSGEIASYGLLYETGGKRAIGFHISARTSLTPPEQIQNGDAIPNKTEIELGPNIKIGKWIYLNLGVGYGYFDFMNANDYSGTKTIDQVGYLVASGGLMIRLSRVININGGVSFMDIDKDFYTPEIVFGVSFNLKRNSRRK